MKFKITESQANFLVTKYSSMVHSIARKVCYNTSDYDDFIQIGFEKLFECHEKYDENHESGSEFHTYAYRAIVRSMVKRKKKLEKRNAFEKNVGVCFSDNTTHEDMICASGQAILPQDTSDTSIDIYEIIEYANLSSIQKKIIELKAMGMTLKEIGEMLSLSAERIRQIHEQTKASISIYLST